MSQYGDPIINVASILDRVDTAARLCETQAQRIRGWAEAQESDHQDHTDLAALTRLRDRIGFVIEDISKGGPNSQIRSLANDMVRLTEAIAVARSDEDPLGDS